MSKYENNLRTYIQSLKAADINFVYMSGSETFLKTTAKILSPKHFVTVANSLSFYIYVYRQSDVKYFMTQYQGNQDPIKILNFKIAETQEENDHHYTANHGDHLTFGIDYTNATNTQIKINTHRTIYELAYLKQMTYFVRRDGDSCHFKFVPVINKIYNTFENIPCLFNDKKINESHSNKEDKSIIFHLLNKMNNIDVPVTLQPQQGAGNAEGGGKNFGSYKNYDFMSEEFLQFIRSFLIKIGSNVAATLCYDSNYKNIVCFIDLEEINRLVLIIHCTKALKACYAHYHPEVASKAEHKILKTFSTHFDIKMNKIKKIISR